MNLMDILSADTADAIYQDTDNNMQSILDQAALSTEINSSLEENLTQSTNGVYFLPTVLTKLQKELIEIVLQIFSSELLNEVYLKRQRTRIDSLLESSTIENDSLNSFDKVSFLFDQLSIINRHPSLLVDHFIPKKLLLSETNERLVNLSGNLQLFNRMVDSFIGREEDIIHMLVVAQSVKELELVESLIIGKKLYYNNLSSGKLYEDRRSIPDCSKANGNIESKLCLYLITSSQLYNNYTQSLSKGKAKFNLIFSFDANLDTKSPSIELLRSDSIVTPIMIPLPIYSLQHMILQIPEPSTGFHFDKDTSNPTYKWKLQVIHTLVVNRFNLFESDDTDFFLENYGSNMNKLYEWFHKWDSIKYPSNYLKKFTDKLALNFTTDKLIKKLETNYLNEKMDFMLDNFDYETYKAKFAEILNNRLSHFEYLIADKYQKEIPSLRISETLRQVSYDDDEEKIADNYRKRRRLNEDVSIAERKLARVENDLIKYQEKKQDLTNKLEFLTEKIKSQGFKKRIEDQNELIKELNEEFDKITSEYEKLNDENETIRLNYQNSSAEAVQKSMQLNQLKEKNLMLESKINGVGVKLLPSLIKKDELINYELELNKLRKENQFIVSFFTEKLDKLVKERNAIIETTNTGSSTRPSNRISRASTPF